VRAVTSAHSPAGWRAWAIASWWPAMLRGKIVFVGGLPTQGKSALKGGTNNAKQSNQMQDGL